MKSKLLLVILFTFIALGVHGYLTYHYYPLNFGMMESSSACSINETLDCDAVAASTYSSFLGIPLSVWGLATHLILLIFLLLGLTSEEDADNEWLQRSYFLALFSVFASLVMGIISFVALKTFCLFCITLYVLSLIIFALLHTSAKFKFIPHFNKAFVGALIAIPLISFFTHRSFLSHYGADKLKQVINDSIQAWESNPQGDFTLNPSLKKGNENAKFVISEFADFLCGHCKKAAPGIRSFARSHPDIQVRFYVFPLDGACNDAIGRSNGISCRLAKATYCGNEQKLGWKIHDMIFDQQADFYTATGSLTQLNAKLKSILSGIKTFDWEKLTTCMDSEETHNEIKKQAQLGEDVGIKGTPTIFANGRKLPRGQLIPVLEAAYQRAIKK